MIQVDTERARAWLSGPFAGLCSLAEFAELQHVQESAIRHAIRNGKFRAGIDCMKFGKQWVMSKEAFKTYNGDYRKYSEFETTCYRKKIHDDVN